MSWLKSLLAVLACVVLAGPAFANTASDENGGSSISGLSSNGKVRLIYAGLIGSDLVAADTNATAFDFGSLNSGQGMTVVLHMYDDENGFTCTSGVCVMETGGTDNCSGTPTATFTTAPFKNAGDNASPTSARAIATDSVITDNSAVDRVITLNTQDTPLDRYLFTTMSGDAACTGIDIAVYIYERL